MRSLLIVMALTGVATSAMADDLVIRLNGRLYRATPLVVVDVTTNDVVPGPITPGPVVPPTPNPPKPATSGPVTSVVVRIAAKLTPEQSLALITIREWVDSQDSKLLIHYVLNPDPEDVDSSAGGDDAKRLIAKIPAGKSLPYCFITQKDSSGTSVIKWQGELTDAATYIAKLKEVVPHG